MSARPYNPSERSIFEAKHHVCTACVGDNGLNDFQTYATGYFEAAEVLLDQVIDYENGLTEDTLVYPILFNLRHGVELSIKHLARVLFDAGLKPQNEPRIDHELANLWAALAEQAQGDRHLTAAISELTPAVSQLHEADPLAQEFRYSERRDGVPSFKGREVVDLVTVLDLTKFAAEKFRALFWLADRVADERRLGSFTADLNREELEQLSKALPPADTWKSSETFTVVRTEWMAKYQLSSRAFSQAVDFIKGHREFAANIGLVKPLAVLDEATLIRLVTGFNQSLSAKKAASRDIPKLLVLAKSRQTTPNTLGITLTEKLVGEVWALFHLGRDAHFSEVYESLFDRYSRYPEPAAMSVLSERFMHVFEKRTFSEHLRRGLRMIGHHRIADTLDQLPTNA